MLASNPSSSAPVGSLDRDVHKPATFSYELLGFLGDELPRWRDHPERSLETAETNLTSQLCAHLNSAARRSPGWDILQFRVEEPDEVQAGRKIDLVSSPCGVCIWIEGRRHTDFDTLMPLECKRLPIPKGKDRDEREYVFSGHSSTGGIQRFKEGNHGAAHTLGAMIAYVQEGLVSVWDERIAGWIAELAGVQPGWSTKDFLSVEKLNPAQRITVLRSNHEREKGLSNIELRHLWIEMN